MKEQNNAKRRSWITGKSKGLATVEIILIILILVALALIFRETIIGFVEGLMEGLSDKGDEFMNGEIYYTMINANGLWL